MPKESINPQGIKKGSDIRDVFTLSPKTNNTEPMVLSGGDFSGFEVAIACAVYGDKNLTEDLLSGKKIHALWGESIYKMSYEEVFATEKLPETDPKGFYSRSKKSFFAKLYDAQVLKLSQVLQLSEEETYEGIQNFEKRYPGVAKAKELIYSLFQAMTQPDGIGTAIKWKEPQKYVESFLGFKRYFNLEFSVIRSLFDLAQNPTKEMKQLKIKVRRRDRTQSASGALQSAVYAAAFSIQSALIRSAVNHVIQSPGGEMTKILQSRIWELQPKGIHPWKVMPFNAHDEIQCPVVKSLISQLENIIKNFIEEYKEYVPLLKMDWYSNLKTWGDK